MSRSPLHDTCTIVHLLGYARDRPAYSDDPDVDLVAVGSPCKTVARVGRGEACYCTTAPRHEIFEATNIIEIATIAMIAMIAITQRVVGQRMRLPTYLGVDPWNGSSLEPSELADREQVLLVGSRRKRATSKYSSVVGPEHSMKHSSAPRAARAGLKCPVGWNVQVGGPASRRISACVADTRIGLTRVTAACCGHDREEHARDRDPLRSLQCGPARRDCTPGAADNVV